MTSLFASPPPDAAIEISPEAVSVAAVTARGGEMIVHAHATEPLPVGAVVPGLTGHNILERAAVAGALRSALDRASLRPRRVALVIPDTAARVSLVRFDRIPERREDLDQLVRWQVRKATPFPIEQAAVSYSPGAPVADGGGELVVVLARQDVVREYERVCEDEGLHAGLVDLSTLSVLNLFLSSRAPKGDWLLVHVRPEYLSLAIMRGEHMIFFRNHGEDEDEALASSVHQTAMYYQDRLEGRGFDHVLLGGIGRTPAAIDEARGSIEERLRVGVEMVDTTRAAGISDRITADPELQATLAPLVGILLRTRREVAAA
jgi:type IV pilus assembly protein PilM